MTLGRTLVTGAAGFIGQHLTRRLLECGNDSIVALDNLRRGKWEGLRPFAHDNGLRLVTADVREAAMLPTLFQGAQTVFHLAAQSNVLGAAADMTYAFESNVVGAFNVLLAARAAGVRCVVFTSSREVYGEPQALPVAETAPRLAKNMYGASKLAAEAYCRVFDTPAMRVVILRLANVYGPGDQGRVIPLFIEAAGQHQPLQLNGGQQVIDFVPVALVVEALIRAAEVQPAEPINIGSGQGTTLPALAEQIVRLCGSRAGWEFQPAHTIEVVRFVANVERMRRELGLEPPQHPLEKLPELVAALAVPPPR